MSVTQRSGHVAAPPRVRTRDRAPTRGGWTEHTTIRWAARWGDLGIIAVALATAVARLPFIDSPLTTDEGGFLTVARQWAQGHGGLYGHFWVDRPPLLIEVFRIADDLGGLIALRLIGCVLAAATALAVGVGVKSALGRRAAVWASVVTGALLASPMLGSLPVNGELIAAPFVAWAIACTVIALRRQESLRTFRLAFAMAGACAAAAVLVKQNMIDGGVFAAVLGGASFALGGLDARTLRRGAGWFAGGATALTGSVMALAALRGTSAGGVFFAMYPFRLKAAHLTSVVGSRAVRLDHLGLAEVSSLAPAVLVAFVIVTFHRHRRARSIMHERGRSGGRWCRPAFAIATVAVTGYACASILASGSYWSHYLVELAVPLGCAAGVVAAGPPRWARALLVAPAVTAAISIVIALGAVTPAPGQIAGAAIGAVAHRGDSIVVVLGSSDVVESSGLRSPYRYLWSLPSRVLDPHMDHLRALLTGRRAPTWFVVRSTWTAGQLRANGLDPVLERHYRRVADVCGRVVYLRDGAVRPRPVAAASCDLPFAPWAHPGTSTRSTATSPAGSSHA